MFVKLFIIMTMASISNGFMPNNMMSANNNNNKSMMTLSMSSSPTNSNDSLGRRDVIKIAGSMLTISSLASFADVAQAKDKEPVAIETVRESFQAVKDELNNGGISELAAIIEKEDYDEIMEFTKNYDLEFRKAKMGKARKFLTSKEDKEKAVLLCNAVTFDLIGMNKGSRVGQRNIEQVKKYYGELKTDVQSFLDLEQNIDVTAYISQ